MTREQALVEARKLEKLIDGRPYTATSRKVRGWSIELVIPYGHCPQSGFWRRLRAFYGYTVMLWRAMGGVL